MTFVLNLLLASTGSLAFAILYNVPRNFICVQHLLEWQDGFAII